MSSYGSRICQERGRQPLIFGRKPVIWQHFCRKVHEIKEIKPGGLSRPLGSAYSWCLFWAKMLSCLFWATWFWSGPPVIDPGHLKLSVTGLNGQRSFKTYRHPWMVNISEVFRDILKQYVLQTVVAKFVKCMLFRHFTVIQKRVYTYAKQISHIAL